MKTGPLVVRFIHIIAKRHTHLDSSKQDAGRKECHPPCPERVAVACPSARLARAPVIVIIGSVVDRRRVRQNTLYYRNQKSEALRLLLSRSLVGVPVAVDGDGMAEKSGDRGGAGIPR